MLTYLKKRPMLLLAGLASVIIALSNLLNGITLIAGILTIGACFVMLIRKKLGLILMFLLPLSVIIASLFAMQSKIENCEKVTQKTLSGNFVVINEPEDYTYGNSVYIKPLSGEYKNTEISLTYNKGAVCMGDIINTTVSIKSIKDKSYKNSFYASGVMFFGTAKADIKVTGENAFYKTLYKIRSYIKATLFEYTDYDCAATLSAILIGDKSCLTDGFSNCITAAGLSHVMVVSGMHLSIIMSATVLLLEKLFYSKYFKALLTVLIAFFMCAVCGFTPSVIRAGIMSVAVALSFILKRDCCSENILGLTVAIMYIFNPYYFFSVSFELSVLSTFGILTLSPAVLSFINIKNKIAYYAVSVAVCSISALIVTAPVTIYRFGGFSTVAVITNIAVSFAVTAALSTALAALLICLICPIFAVPVFFICNLITKYINAVIVLFGSLKYAYISVNPDFFLIGLSAVAVSFVLFGACNKHRYMVKLKQIRSELLAKGGKKLKWR